MKLKQILEIFCILVLTVSCTGKSASTSTESDKAKDNSKSNASELRILEEFKTQRPKFKKLWIKIKDKKVQVELAGTPIERQFGLMYVENLPANQGMLFKFEAEQFLSFWMKNTLIPLSIAFLNKKRKIVDIKEMKPARSLYAKKIPSYSSNALAIYAIEMNAQWFEENNINIGDSVEFLEGI